MYLNLAVSILASRTDLLPCLQVKRSEQSLNLKLGPLGNETILSGSCSVDHLSEGQRCVMEPKRLRFPECHNLVLYVGRVIENASPGRFFQICA
jgi:hypothetical protein